MSTGAPLLGRMLDDVVHVVRVTRTAPERTVVFGRSVGSIFALEAAARFPNLAGVIIESGVADPLERLLLRLQPEELGVTSEAFAAALSSRLDHKEKLARYDATRRAAGHSPCTCHAVYTRHSARAGCTYRRNAGRADDRQEGAAHGALQGRDLQLRQAPHWRVRSTRRRPGVARQDRAEVKAGYSTGCPRAERQRMLLTSPGGLLRPCARAYPGWR